LIVKNKNIRKLQLNEEEMIYFCVQVKHKIIQYGEIIITYKDIVDIKIEQNVFQNHLKITTKDGFEHNVPIGFPRKDMEEIIIYIIKRI
jgi:hypothetical protein